MENEVSFILIIANYSDMTMGAITKNYNIGDSAVKSVNAGSDIVLACIMSDFYKDFPGRPSGGRLYQWLKQLSYIKSEVMK